MSSVVCPGCDTEYASTALACPHCRRLVHADELKTLGSQAEAARQGADKAGEREAWRKALVFLPAGSRQRESIERRVAELEAEPEAAQAEERPAWTRGGGVVGGLALILWKAKSLILLALGKLKFLTLGLSKASTLLSLLASFGVYWTLWGWRYALGFLVAMYIHEMGHVAALRRFGIPASAPMFVPGLGAFVRMNQHPATKGEDARIGLAGPEWGFGAALAAYLAYEATGNAIWAAIGHSAAYLNLFNLLPVWQLDGGRGFAALDRSQRAIVCAILMGAWAATREGLLGLIGMVALYRAFFSDRPESGDLPVLARFAWLVAAFSAMLLFGQPR